MGLGETEIKKHIYAGERLYKQAALEPAFEQLSKALELSLTKGYELTATEEKLVGLVCAHSGRFRRGISQIRWAIQKFEDPQEKALLYFQLAKIYRILVRLKNQRLELRRAFEVLNLQYPTSSVSGLFADLFAFIRFWIFFRPRKLSESSRTSLELRGLLHQEAGLSAYFLGERIALVRIVLRAWQIAKTLGPSEALVKWFGSSSIAAAALGYPTVSNRLIKSAESVIRDVPGAKDQYLIWKMINLEWSGKSKESQQLARETLKELTLRIDLFDVRPVWITYLNSLALQGKMLELAQAIRDLTLVDESVGLDKEVTGKESMQWFQLPAHVFLGELNSAQEIMNNLRSALSVVDSERWITKYIGDVLLFYIETNRSWDPFVDDLIGRADGIPFEPSLTPFESYSLFINKARVYLQRIKQPNNNQNQESVSLKKFRKAIKEMRQLGRHPTLVIHRKLLLGEAALLRKQSQLCERFAKEALELSVASDDPWGKFESDLLLGEYYQSQNDFKTAKTHFTAAKELSVSRQWSQKTMNLESRLKNMVNNAN